MRNTALLLSLLVLLFPLSCKKKERPAPVVKGTGTGSGTPMVRGTGTGSGTGERGLKVKFVPIEEDSSLRNALVIGNGDYKKISHLKNPLNDASDMAKALRGVGFTVMEHTNVSRSEMGKAIHEFGNRLKKGGVGLFYYAGHGVQVKGVNYLLPIGTEIKSEEDVQYEALDAGRVLSKMKAAKNQMNIVILDACRDNPFARSFRSVERGLARMDAPSGTLLVYATAPGGGAQDGKGRNGTFTKALLKYMEKSDIEILRMMNYVAVSVQKDTGGVQEPWISHSPLEKDFYFRRSGKTTTPPSSGDPFSLEELQKWAGYMGDMRKAARLVQTFEQGDGSLDSKILAWEKFLKQFSRDNPNTKEDDDLREKGKKALSTLTERKVSLEEERQKLEKERRKEETKKRVLVRWDTHLKKMILGYKSALEIENGNYVLDIKIQAWQGFLREYREDNPYSSEDENMRERARGYIKVLVAKKRAEEEKTAEKDDPYEPNNTLAEVHTISAGSLSGILKKGDTDWYRVKINFHSSNSTRNKLRVRFNFPSTLTITLRFTHSKGDLELALYNSSGSELDKSTGSKDTETIKKDISFGPVYIKVYGSIGAANAYSLEVGIKKKPSASASSISGFTYLRTATYSAGGQTHTVKEYRHDATGLEFVLVPGGSFQMGDTMWSDSQPVHTVRLKPFLIGKTEVTQKVYEKIMGNNPSNWKRDDLPVEQVSWNDAKSFCQKAGLSFPSEAQWEYACRAGTTTAFYWGGSADGDYMWYDGNSGSKIHSVGQKKPNAYGLYDMSGNVWEWVEDNWNSNYNGAPTDGTSWLNKGSGVVCSSGRLLGQRRRWLLRLGLPQRRRAR